MSSEQFLKDLGLVEEKSNIIPFPVLPQIMLMDSPHAVVEKHIQNMVATYGKSILAVIVSTAVEEISGTRKAD